MFIPRSVHATTTKARKNARISKGWRIFCRQMFSGLSAELLVHSRPLQCPNIDAIYYIRYCTRKISALRTEFLFRFPVYCRPVSLGFSAGIMDEIQPTVNAKAATVLCWNFRPICVSQVPSRNRIVAPARQPTQAGRIDSLESIPGLLKSLKIPSLGSFPESSDTVESERGGGG